MKKSTFTITQMDCSSEEQMIKMKLGDFQNIIKLEFDLPARKLIVFHSDEITMIHKAIDELNLNASLISSEDSEELVNLSKDHGKERTLLWLVLVVNFAMFILEIIMGFIANSMGLIADSLDMLADAFVYALSLYAVGRLSSTKKQIAKISGYLQLLLAGFGILETIRRFVSIQELPGFQSMIVISFIALLGNAISLYVLQKSKSKEAHMQASIIFTNNDVLVNVGVIIAGVFVYFTNTKLPDLIVGGIVFVFVARGAFRILKLAR